MATLSYSPTISTWWTGTVSINYSVSYNLSTNQTTVTFAESSHAYFGRKNYGSSAATTLTVTATDNAAGTATATFETSGATNGGTKTFTGTPSPASVTVQHLAVSTTKSVTIAGSTTIKVYATSTATGQSTATGSGSVTAVSATASAYTLTLNPSGTSLSATLYSSPFRSAGGALATGAAVYGGETVKITFSAATGYESPACAVSGVGSIASGGTFTVSANHTVTATATRKSYTLAIEAGKNAVVSVLRDGTALSDGAELKHFDVLSVTVSAQSGYKISAAAINGTALTPGAAASHTVCADVTVTAAAEALSGVFIGAGETKKRYMAVIDTGGVRKQYRAARRNGGVWEYC